jgi:dihydroxyacetone kinase-like protein
MNRESITGAILAISAIMDQNKDYLVELDARNGDGDLGISMAAGYKALADFLSVETEKDLGMLLMKSARVFNEAAPSSLGTIMSFAFMGMAKKLKGKEEATVKELAEALINGINLIMEKAKSKPGEKTILDSLLPGGEALLSHSGDDKKVAFEAAAKAAAEGCENTKNMISVHGRAAYYGEKSLGIVDGGAVVGKLIFDALNGYISNVLD